MLGLACHMAWLVPLHASQELGLKMEAMAADDIVLNDYSTYFQLIKGDYKTVLSYKHAGIWIDYQPPVSALVGTPTDRHSEMNSLRVSTQGPAGQNLLWLAEGGAYQGFQDFKSLWLDEYYHQLFANFPGYKEFDPYGSDILLGLRWDYLPASALAKVSVLYAHDRVSPAWEPVIGKGLSSTSPTLHSVGARIELENVLTTRFRTHNSLSVNDKTERAPRWSFESMDNYALSDSWVAKGTLGGALESPEFTAFWTTATLEWDYQKTWFLGLNTRFYQDSGETDDFLPFGVNAPPAKAFGVSASLRWIDGANQASIAIGPYWTRYDGKNLLTSPVATLYSDRSWLWFQAAWSHQF